MTKTEKSQVPAASTRRGFLMSLMAALAGMVAARGRASGAEGAPGGSKPIDNVFVPLRTPKPGYIRR